MKISISCLQFALNFFLNRILIFYVCSQIFDLFHPLKETIINVYTLTSSRLVHCTKIESLPLRPHREHIAHYKHTRTRCRLLLQQKFPFVSKVCNISASTSHHPNTAAFQYGYPMINTTNDATCIKRPS